VRLRILDFGIAKWMGSEERSSSGHTATRSTLHAFLPARGGAGADQRDPHGPATVARREGGELVVNMKREPVGTIASPSPRASGAAEARRGPGAGPWVVLRVGVAASATAGKMLGLAESERLTRDHATAQGPVQAADASFRTYASGDVLLGVGVARVARVVVGVLCGQTGSCVGGSVSRGGFYVSQCGPS